MKKIFSLILALILTAALLASPAAAADKTFNLKVLSFNSDCTYQIAHISSYSSVPYNEIINDITITANTGCVVACTALSLNGEADPSEYFAEYTFNGVKTKHYWEQDGYSIPLTEPGEYFFYFGYKSGVTNSHYFNITIEGEPTKQLFKDVPLNTYYAPAVNWAVENGITNGTTTTTFSPAAACSRAQVVTFLWRANGCPEPEDTANPFTDVRETDYFYKPVLWAISNGITEGTSDTAFSPNATCTYAHTLTFLWRSLGKPGETGSGANWYDDARNWAKKAGCLEQTPANDFINYDCPRRDVVTFLYRNAGIY